MRFLTRAWHAGHLADAEADATLAAFHAHRATVLPQLPPQARAFAEAVDVHDALLQAIHVEQPAGTLTLALRAGDQAQGYFDLRLTYHGVHWSTLDRGVLQLVAEEPRAEALYVEEDIVEAGWYVHRWLWWPYGREVDIGFADLTYDRTPRADRAFVRPGAPYTERLGAAV